uniref:Developmentally regulated GTP binding protein 1 n=1 Tax=Mus musculus TaxID=10090 RepID=D6RHA5_MOUSE
MSGTLAKIAEIEAEVLMWPRQVMLELGLWVFHLWGNQLC